MAIYLKRHACQYGHLSIINCTMINQQNPLSTFQYPLSTPVLFSQIRSQIWANLTVTKTLILNACNKAKMLKKYIRNKNNYVISTKQYFTDLADYGSWRTEQHRHVF